MFFNNFKDISQKCDNIVSRWGWGHASPPALLFISLILQEPTGLLSSPLRPELRKSLDYRGECEPGGNNNSAGMPASVSSGSSTKGCKSPLLLENVNKIWIEQELKWTEITGMWQEAVVVITQSIVTPDCKITSYHIYNTLLCAGLNVIHDPYIENLYCKS